jgi:exopolyphosphatase / guanosine-5'-triphosphate,3'-diphosphate pyrophosphatase
MRIAAIDVGTNTVLLVVADVEDGRLTVVADEERFARLGQGVDGAGRLAPEAMDRVVDRLTAYRVTAEGLGAEQIVIGATSASRDASNVDTLIARVRDEVGLDYQVIAGETEAALSFRGALALMPDLADGQEAAVVDIGGGSTEVVAGRKGEAPSFRVSLDVGSVRVTERFFSQRPPRPEQVEAATAFVAEALARVPDGVAAVRPLVTVAGTAKVAARLVGATDTLAAADVRAWRDRLLALTPDETLALDPALMTGRADVAAAGLLVLAAVLDRFGAERLRFSPAGLRHGLALAAAESGS